MCSCSRGLAVDEGVRFSAAPMSHFCHAYSELGSSRMSQYHQIILRHYYCLSELPKMRILFRCQMRLHPSTPQLSAVTVCMCKGSCCGPLIQKSRCKFSLLLLPSTTAAHCCRPLRRCTTRVAKWLGLIMLCMRQRWRKGKELCGCSSGRCTLRPSLVTFVFH